MTDTSKASIASIVDAHREQPGALLPILHAIQDTLGYVPREALPAIGRALHLSRAEVHGVVTFYPHFRQHPVGRHVIHICRAEACQAMGADELAMHAQAALGVEMHETTSDGQFTLEPVYCLGNCACSPAMMVDGDLFGRVDAQRFDAIVAARKASS